MKPKRRCLPHSRFIYPGGRLNASSYHRSLYHLTSHPKDTWFFTDPNKDPDDVVTYTLGKQLQAEGFVHITDVVATLGDAEVRSQRAEMAKGVFMHRP